MGQVNVIVNGRQYSIMCGDGEERHIEGLAGSVDRRMRDLQAGIGPGGAQVGENKLLLMAALLIADDLSTLQKEVEALKASAASASEAMPETMAMPGASFGEEEAAELESLADRIEAVAARLENT